MEGTRGRSDDVIIVVSIIVNSFASLFWIYRSLAKPHTIQEAVHWGRWNRALLTSTTIQEAVPCGCWNRAPVLFPHLAGESKWTCTRFTAAPPLLRCARPSHTPQWGPGSRGLLDGPSGHFKRYHIISCPLGLPLSHFSLGSCCSLSLRPSEKPYGAGLGQMHSLKPRSAGLQHGAEPPR